MSKISIYEVVPVPKLADKLVGTSVGGDPEDITYNFTLSELLNLFIPNIPGNTLQGVLDFGNTATQNINLTGIITTTTLNVGGTTNILNSNLTGQTHITGGLYDRLNSIGTAGQVLTSTGTQVEWYTIPTVIPDLQQVLTSGNTAVNNIILTGNLSANNAALLTSTISTSLTLLGTLRDGLSSVGTNNQVLSSNVTGVRWVNLPVYSATSPLLYNSGTGVFSIQQANASQNGYLSSADWITFDGKQTAISLTTTGNSGASTLVGATINVPNYTLSGLGGVPLTRTLTINGVTYNLSADRSWTLATGVSSVSATTPLFSTGGVNPDISIQQSSSSLDGYLSSTDWLTFNSKQPAGNYITSLTGEATGLGPGAAAVILSNAAVIGKLLTGLSITGSAISSSDSILTAFGKVQNQINGLIGGVQFQGVWNAATNTPALVSSVGTQGYYYIVDVAGNTNLNGISDWQIGDWAIFNGSTWNKVDNTDLVTSVNGQVGAVSLTTDNIPEGATNLYYLDSRARAALSFAAGSGAYNSTTGVITIPTDNSQILNGAGYITLVSLSATSPLTYNNTTGVFSIQVANTTQDGYLSSTDWNTFNGKQPFLGGTGLVKSVAGVISYITDNSSNWNTAYNDSIVSAAVTGTATKTLTLNQQDGGTITASWSDIDTGLTSVGVSMPSAFTVTNSPLTSNGTIAITGSGNTLQYVDGTGALQTFPSLTGYVPYTGATANVNLGIYNLTAASLIKNGGTSGQFLKADGSVDSSAYIVLGSLSATAPLSYNNTTGVFTISQSGASTNGYLSSTDWNTFNNKQATITLTTTGSSGASTLIGNTLNIPNYANLVTSVFGRIGAVVATEGDYSLTQLSDVTITTPSSGQVLKYNGTAWVNDIDTDTGITSLNGLTALTQTFAVGTSGTDFAISSVTSTHTFNLPTASVSNRGALSSADWTTFNSKEPAIIAGTTLQYYRGDKTFQTLNTTAVPEGTNLYFTNARAIASTLTGYVSGAGTITSVDSLLTAIQKLNGNIGGLTTGVSSVFGRTGAVIAVSGDYTTTLVPEGTNLYYLDSRARTAISLTTTGSSGAATYNNTTGVFNIPDYGSALSGYVPTSRQLSINGTQYDLSADRSWSVGTVTTVSFTLGSSGTNLNSVVTNSTTTPAITLNVPTASAANRGALSAADWSTFNTKVGGVTATTPLFSSGGSTPNLTIQQSNGSQAGYLSSTDWTTFNNKQAAGNYITSLTGEATATGPGAAAVTLDNAAVTAKILTGVNITGGTILSTDSILTGFGKLQNQVNGLIGGSIYQGTWNASTNTPTLTSSVGTAGYYYIVSVAGNTNLNGITDWQVGDWAIFNGGVWQKVDNTDSVISVNGQTGAVSLTTDNISEGVTNLYFTNTRARAALSFVAGSGAYDSSTGAITIPTNTSQLTNGANFITLASLSGTAPISYNSGTGAISITQSGTASNGYLSSTDWNTFNNKQATLSLTTIGTSGAATLVGATLNIPDYGSALSGYVPTSRQLTINGTAYDLSADRSWSVGTVTSITLATGTTGTDVNVSNGTITSSGTITLNIPDASATARGLITTGTQTIAGAKTFTSQMTVSTGPASIVIKPDNSSNGGILWRNSVNGGHWSITSDPSSIGAQGVWDFRNDNLSQSCFSIAPTTNIVTFSSNIIASSLIKSGGTSAQYLMADGSTSTLTNPVTGTGTTNYLPKWTSGSAIGNSILQESGNAIGLGNTPSSWGYSALQIGNAAFASATFGTTVFNWVGSNWIQDGVSDKFIVNGRAALISLVDGGLAYNYTPTAGTAGGAITFTLGFRVVNNGNFLINSNTDAGYKLDVNGTGRFSGALQVKNDQGTSVDAQLRLRGTNATARTTRLQFEDYNGTLADGFIDFKIPTAGNASSATLSIGINVPNLTFVSTGAATFSSSVTAGGSITSSGSMGRFGGWYDALGFTGAAVEAGVSGGIGYVIGYNRSGSAAIPIVLGNAGNTSSMVGSSLSFTGAATFSSSIAATSLLLNGGSLIGNFTINGGTGDTTTQNAIQTFTRTSSTGNVLAGKIVLVASDTNHGNLVLRVKSTASSAESDTYYTNALTLAGTTGAATFSSSVTATSATFSGNVGINTTSLVVPLTVRGTTDRNLEVSGSGGVLLISSIDNARALYKNFGIDGSALFLQSQSGGNVGIGNTSPAYKLDVSGTGNFTGALSGTSATFSSSVTAVATGIQPLIHAKGGGDAVGMGKGNFRTSDQGGANYWDFGRDNLTTGDFVITQYGGSPNLRLATTTGAATFSSSVTAGGTITQTSSAATLILNRTGGTTFGAGVQYQTSGTNNWIAGTAQASVGTDYSIYNYSTATGAINITYTTNNVQIGGTTDAGYKLDVNGTGRFSSNLLVNGSITSKASGVGTLNLGTDTYTYTNTAGQIIATSSPSYTSSGKLSFKVLTWGVGSDYGPTEQMYIDVTAPDTKSATLVMLPFGGNVGIGNISAIAKLHVTGNLLSYSEAANTAALFIAANNSYNWQFGINNGSDYVITENGGVNAIGTIRFSVKPGGNVLIGTTTDAGYKLDIAGASRSAYHIFRSNESAPTADAFIFRPADNTVALGTNNTERMRITSGGALCLGVTSAYGTNLLNVNGGIYSTGAMAAVVAADVDLFTFISTDASYTHSCFVGSIAAAGSTSSYYFYGQQSTSTVSLKIFSNGNIQNTNNSYGAISDARLKENIIDATPKLEDLMKVKVRNYNLKGESNKQLGVISQELEEIFPNMIEESTNIGESMKIKGVKYSVFVPMLIKAIQEQQEQINYLKSKIQ